MRRDERSGLKIFAVLALLGAICVGIFYLYNSPYLEQNPPKIGLEEQVYWNLQDPFEVEISDDSGIKEIAIYLETEGKKELLSQIRPTTSTTHQILKIALPKSMILNKNLDYKITFEVRDISFWNFFMGNKTKDSFKIVIDDERPKIQFLTNSYSIKRGGSAAVVFSVSDEHLKELYIQTDSGDKFEVKPFVKEGYYAAIVAWPANKNSYAAYVVAKDKALNESKRRIRYYVDNRKFKDSTIALNDRFINGKISDLVEIYAKEPSSLVGTERFKFVNETLRAKNEELIREKSGFIKESSLDPNFKLSPFMPLRGSRVVAGFGDHRYYTYNKKPVSESWHLGLDVASFVNADIAISNDGEVLFVGDNGIYGNTILVYHGFGISSLYAHCSAIGVSSGDNVKDGDIIGKTGNSGLAFGDHLHFGVIVQGYEVNPFEWMDKKWMEENIYKVFKRGKEIIDVTK
ncbi:M23 family metallopeptidase [uncultured Campylobacter sp.]|uniref:M23 family metallopeptidase n=1 Tax=uncultured Campylobacter sp. TaxID=218934 RepID=UPI00260C6209|nr:M23 family metallopeptidase [uncultured Campylobacter sp.]